MQWSEIVGFVVICLGVLFVGKFIVARDIEQDTTINDLYDQVAELTHELAIAHSYTRGLEGDFLLLRLLAFDGPPRGLIVTSDAEFDTCSRWESDSDFCWTLPENVTFDQWSSRIVF